MKSQPLEGLVFLGGEGPILSQPRPFFDTPSIHANKVARRIVYYRIPNPYKIDQRRVDVLSVGSNVLAGIFVRPSVTKIQESHKKIQGSSKNIYGLTISYTGFVQSRIVLSHSTCVVKIITCQ